MNQGRIAPFVVILVFLMAGLFLTPSLKPVVPHAKFAASFLIVTLLVLAFIFYAVSRYGIKQTIFISIPYLIVLFCLEIGFRIWISNYASPIQRSAFLTPFTVSEGLGKNSLYVPNHYTLYSPRPNLSLPDGTRHNNLGLRDHRKLQGNHKEIRIVFIGGSTTYSTGIRDNQKIFSAQLERLLNQNYKLEHEIQVVNAGMGGSTSAENLLRLIFFVSEIEPNVVVIQHGLNDVWPRMQGTIKSDFSNYRRSWATPNYFILNRPIAWAVVRRVSGSSVFLNVLMSKLGMGTDYDIGDMVIRREIRKDPSMLSSNDTRYFERNTRYIVAICKAMGAKVVLATEPYWDRAGEARKSEMPKHHQILAKVAREEGVMFYDFFSDMPKNKQYMPDGRHENEMGSDLKAGFYYAFFQKEKIIENLLSPDSSER